MTLDTGFIEGLIARHNDKEDKLVITNINLSSAVNISLTSTMNSKGNAPLEADFGLGYLIILEEVDNGNGSDIVTKYISVDDISQITTREFEYKKRVPGQVYPKYN